MNYQQRTKINNLLNKLNFKKTYDFVIEQEYLFFKIDYSGSGDSGQIDSISLKKEEGDSYINLASENDKIPYSGGINNNDPFDEIYIECSKYVFSSKFTKDKFKSVIQEEVVSLYECISDIAYAHLYRKYPGFENNSGGFGTIDLEFSTNGEIKVDCDHSFYVIEEESSEEVLSTKENNELDLINEILENVNGSPN